MQKPLHILGISGSLRSGSVHTAILKYLGDTVPEHTFTICDGIEDIPNFNPEKDISPAPAAVQHFRGQLAAADMVIICTPEYAYGIPGALKNALDWVVSSGEMVDKPVGVITASGLGEHAHAALLLVLTAMNAKIPEGSTLLIPWIKSKLNAANEIIDPGTISDVESILNKLIKIRKYSSELF